MLEINTAFTNKNKGTFLEHHSEDLQAQSKIIRNSSSTLKNCQEDQSQTLILAGNGYWSFWKPTSTNKEL